MNKWTFDGDMYIKYGTTEEMADLPTPDDHDTFFRGEPIVFYNMDTVEVYMYDYISKTWKLQ